MSQLSEAYALLLNNPNQVFVFHDGHCNELPPLKNIDVYPGSWNPLHVGHLDIYNFALKNNPDANFFFELSLHRRGKEVLSLEELRERLLVFGGWAKVLLTNNAYFFQKTRSIRTFAPDVQIHYHVGFDTAQRVVCDHPNEHFYHWDMNFIVYPRDGMCHRDLYEFAEIEIVNDYFTPGDPSNNQYVSSTHIRELKSNGKH